MIRSLIGVLCVLVVSMTCTSNIFATMVDRVDRYPQPDTSNLWTMVERSIQSNSRPSKRPLRPLVPVRLNDRPPVLQHSNLRPLFLRHQNEASIDRLVASLLKLDVAANRREIDYRFYASPVKRTPNWRMPNLPLGSAKTITSAINESVTYDAKTTGGKFTIGQMVRGVYQFSVTNVDRAASAFTDCQDSLRQVVIATAPKFLPTPDPSVVSESSKAPNRSAIKLAQTGREDYWNYYADCDRWEVVFAKPQHRSRVTKVAENQAAESDWAKEPSAERPVGDDQLSGFGRGNESKIDPILRQQHRMRAASCVFDRSARSIE